MFLHIAAAEENGNGTQIDKDEVVLDDERLARHVIIVMKALGAGVASLDDSR